MKNINKKTIIDGAMFSVSVLLIVFGVLFLLSAAEIAPIFKGFYNIGNVLLRYIIVIITMASGIMLFSGAAARVKNVSLRNGLSIGITAFSTILTLPLVYVFVAIFFAQNGKVDAIGEIMMMSRIVEGFNSWFGSGAFVYVVYTFMLLLSIVFISFPIFSCVLTCKNKTLKIGKQSNGKFGVSIADLENKED